MSKPNIESLATRLDVQEIVLLKLAWVLKPAQAWRAPKATDDGDE